MTEPQFKFEFGKPISIAYLTFEYNPESRHTEIVFYNKRNNKVRNLIIPLEPSVGSYLYKQTHGEKKNERLSSS